MKLIIAGSRTITKSPVEIADIVDSFELSPTTIICGMARGIDMCGATFADMADLPVMAFPADWDKHGKSAGHIRNALMAKEGDVLLLIWDGKSKGSASMKRLMLDAGKPVYEYLQ